MDSVRIVLTAVCWISAVDVVIRFLLFKKSEFIESKMCKLCVSAHGTEKCRSEDFELFLNYNIQLMIIDVFCGWSIDVRPY